MSDSGHVNPVSMTMGVVLLMFGLASALVMLSTFGFELAGVQEPASEEASSWTWWFTHGPAHYPSWFLTGGFLLLLFFFRVYLHI